MTDFNKRKYTHDQPVCLLRPPLSFRKGNVFGLRLKYDPKTCEYLYFVYDYGIRAQAAITQGTYYKMQERSVEI